MTIVWAAVNIEGLMLKRNENKVGFSDRNFCLY